MGLSINSNLIALNAIRNLGLANAGVVRASNRLASGLRINSAADDPAGLMISERFRSEIASLTQAQVNTTSGVSLTETASDGLSEISNTLSEMRKLAVSSATGTLNGSTREQLHTQFMAYMSDIDALANTTTFDDINPLNDSSLQVDIQVGIDAGSANVITVSGVNATASAIGISALTVSTESGASAALAVIDSAIDAVGALSASFGVATNRLEARSRLLAGQIEATSSADSAIRDADAAEESARLAKYQVLQKSAIAILTQANTNHSLALKLLGA